MTGLAISLSLFASFRGNYHGLMLYSSVMQNNISRSHLGNNLPRPNNHNNNASRLFFDVALKRPMSTDSALTMAKALYY